MIIKYENMLEYLNVIIVVCIGSGFYIVYFIFLGVGFILFSYDFKSMFFG